LPGGPARAWWFLDTLVVEHLMATDGGPVVPEQTLPIGAAPPLHIHHDLDDSWYLLEGRIVVQCSDHLARPPPGTGCRYRAVSHTPFGSSVTIRHALC
jgi:hypothetical protein